MRLKIENFIFRFDQTFSGKLKVQIFFIFGLFLLSCVVFSSLLCVTTGGSFQESFWKIFVNMINPVSLNDAAYNLASHSLLSMFFYAIVYLVGVVIWSGLLIATLANILRHRSDSFKQGLLRYSFRDHVVLCGRDRCTPILLKQLVKKYPSSTIIVMADEDVSSLHYSLLSELDRNDEENIVFFRGNRNSIKDLETLNIPFASEVYILSQPQETDSDLKNLNCLNLISNICQNYKKKPRCYVTLFDLSAHALTRTSNALTETHKADIEFSSINYEESWAKIVLVDNKTNKSNIHYLPLDRNGISKDSTQYVHFVILGMSKMGESLALLAAQIAHYPNYVTKKIKTKISLVDDGIDSKRDAFCHKYDSYFSLAKYVKKSFNRHSAEITEFIPEEDYLDIEWEFIESKFSNPSLRAYLDKIAKDKNAILTLALCSDSAECNNNIAFYLPDSLYNPSVQIITKQNISTLISRYSGAKYSNIRSFGMTDESISEDMDKTETYAKMLNFNYCFGRIPGENDSNGVEEAWKNLSVVKRWSNLYSAMTIPSYWRSMSCMEGDDYMEIMSEVEHNRWNTEELLLGYRPVSKEEYDEVCRRPEYKNELKSNYIHFDIRPYDKLIPIDNLNVCEFDKMKIVFVQQCYKMIN